MIKYDDVFLSSTYHFNSRFLQQLDRQETAAVNMEVGKTLVKWEKTKWVASLIFAGGSSVVSFLAASFVDLALDQKSGYYSKYQQEKGYRWKMAAAIVIPIIIGQIISWVGYYYFKKDLIKNKNHESFFERRYLSLKEKIRKIDKKLEKVNNVYRKEELCKAKDYFKLKVKLADKSLRETNIKKG